MAFKEANWSGSALFANKYVNLCQQSWSSNLIGWKLEMGVASLFSMARVKAPVTTAADNNFIFFFFFFFFILQRK